MNMIEFLKKLVDILLGQGPELAFEPIAVDRD